VDIHLFFDSSTLRPRAICFALSLLESQASTGPLTTGDYTLGWEVRAQDGSTDEISLYLDGVKVMGPFTRPKGDPVGKVGFAGADGASASFKVTDFQFFTPKP
jgi:hypothetical protein